MEILHEGGHFFEGPRWRQGAWYVSDLYGHQVLRISEAGEAKTAAKISTEPSGLGWLPDGAMLVVSMSDAKLLRQTAGGTLTQYADLSPFTSGWINDMVVDRHGHAFIGTFGFDLWGGAQPEPGLVCRVDPSGKVSVAADGLMFPNGMVITPDGKTLIIAETFGNRMTAFSIAEDGTLSGRRVWAEFGPLPPMTSLMDVLGEEFAPDGCAMDAQGCIWVADALHNRVCRVAEGGEILEELHTPENWGIYSCALGGADGRTLLVCSAPDFTHENRVAKREAVLFTHQVAVPAFATP